MNDERLWAGLDRLLDRASIDGIVAHRLEPLAAARKRALGEPVPEALLLVERSSALVATMASSLLDRIRASCEGPLVLLKGLELAHLYPVGCRPFSDIDLLVPDARAVHEALLHAGFRPLGHEVPRDHHHLQPLLWQDAGLPVEIHARLNWPAGPRQLTAAEILEARRPSSTGIDGLSAPAPLHHALALTVHGWQHRPLRVLLDLIDFAAASAEVDEQDLERAATALGIGRMWHTTHRAADALFYGSPRSLPLRTWARSLDQLRPRTVREVDLEALLSGFWWMPPSRAARYATTLVRRRLFTR